MGTWGDQPDAKPRPAAKHRKPKGMHRKKGCAAASVILVATLAGWLLGMIVFTALVML